MKIIIIRQIWMEDKMSFQTFLQAARTWIMKLHGLTVNKLAKVVKEEWNC